MIALQEERGKLFSWLILGYWLFISFFGGRGDLLLAGSDANTIGAAALVMVNTVDERTEDAFTLAMVALTLCVCVSILFSPLCSGE